MIKMKSEIPIKIIIGACEVARQNRKSHYCPLYHNPTICSGKACDVPKFMRWLMSDIADPADVSDVGLFTEHKTVPRSKCKK